MCHSFPSKITTLVTAVNKPRTDAEAYIADTWQSSASVLCGLGHCRLRIGNWDGLLEPTACVFLFLYGVWSTKGFFLFVEEMSSKISNDAAFLLV